MCFHLVCKKSLYVSYQFIHLFVYVWVRFAIIWRKIDKTYYRTLLSGINTHEHAPTTTPFTYLNHQQIITRYKVHIKRILKVTRSSVHRIVMHDHPIEPNFDSIVTADSHRHIATGRVRFKCQQGVGGMIIYLTICHADSSQSFIDVIAASSRNLPKRPCVISNFVPFSCTVCCNIRFGDITPTCNGKRVNIYGCCSASARFGRGDHPEPGSRDFFLGMRDRHCHEKCHQTHYRA